MVGIYTSKAASNYSIIFHPTFRLCNILLVDFSNQLFDYFHQTIRIFPSNYSIVLIRLFDLFFSIKLSDFFSTQLSEFFYHPNYSIISLSQRVIEPHPFDERASDQYKCGGLFCGGNIVCIGGRARWFWMLCKYVNVIVCPLVADSFCVSWLADGGGGGRGGRVVATLHWMIGGMRPLCTRR